VIYPNGVNETLSWNSDNTLSQISHKNGATVIEQSQYSYDGLGRRKTNLETLSGTALTYTYQYDPLDRLVSAANGAATQQESYGYDSQNNRVQKQIGNPVTATYAYQYDAAQQLTETHQTSLTGAMLEAYLYDNAGNQTQKCTGTGVTHASNTACTGSTVQGFVYNSFNKMTQITGATTASYRYDDQGRRIQKVEGTNAVNYLYDGKNIYSEYPASSWASPSAAYVQAGTDHPLARLTGNVGDPSATAAYYHQDGLGSVLAATNAAKAVTASQRFGAFGATIAQTGTILQYGYTGREPDAGGMIYYRARYYDANGRFTQRDPLGYADGINRYAYAHNNPINFNDPNGLAARAVATWAQTQGISYVNAGLNAVSPGANAFQQSYANFQAGNIVNAAIWGVQGGVEIAAAAVTGGESQAVKGLSAQGLADLAQFRSTLGLGTGEGTLAKLEVSGQSFYGINAHGQPLSMSVNAITATHAEADAFQQALNAGATGGNATLYVDRALCAACGQNGGVRSMARQLGLDQVTVITPQGSSIITP
jgi:RHS repeat-associated protein